MREVFLRCGWARTAAAVAYVFAWNWAPAAVAYAGRLLSPADQNRLALQIDDRAMVFFVAKGPADSCGLGCDQWIAAEGTLTRGTAQRFQDFLATPSRQRLPVFFHSRGGSVSEALLIARTLRKNRMTAGVGRTVTERCRVFSTKDEACQRLVSSGGDIKARLNLREGNCHSACVYAFVGASRRRVAAGAMLGVHASRIDPSLKQQAQALANARPSTAVNVHWHLQVNLSLLGADPQLEQTASKVDARRIYILSRDEIARFGIETNGPYESPWFPYQDGKRVGLMKSISNQNGSDDSAVVSLECAGSFGLRLGYVRMLTDDDLKYRPNISFGLAGSPEQPALVMVHSGLVTGSSIVPVHLIEHAAENPTIAVVERHPPAADRKSETIVASTRDLSTALTNVIRLCTDPERGGSAR